MYIVYRCSTRPNEELDNDESCVIAYNNLNYGNGITITPDRNTIFVNDLLRRKILIFNETNHVDTDNIEIEDTEIEDTDNMEIEDTDNTEIEETNLIEDIKLTKPLKKINEIQLEHAVDNIEYDGDTNEIHCGSMPNL